MCTRNFHFIEQIFFWILKIGTEKKAERMQQHQKPMTSSELLEKTAKLITSVKSLQKDFENFVSAKEIGDDVDKLIECQNLFWNENMARIFGEIGHNKSDGAIAKHCKILWDNCFLTRFYNEKIFGEWSDLELRQLTIFLAIHNLKKLIHDRVTEIEPQTTDKEQEKEADVVESTAGEPENFDPQIEFTEIDNNEPENADDDDSKTSHFGEASNLSQNSQTEVLSA